jgi:replication initiation protein RepC
LKPELHISQKAWGEGCITLGRIGAAICLLVTDQAMQRETDPVRKPGAYFRAMVNRTHTGELHLSHSIFGILKRDEG